eukprot:CAMPEP_0116954974 /NCGR_PEP_ID=MMETSP0467-20121206/42313_1 /TAXON_ID=283647 /ORGANISM="Mesodinium pulex, Strain SPMC105" /LENGTH=95 /DNA_ID=CAMNT_0004640871 /DNA_START=776 /DNA_END=1063 /DNA_ORIENTATION=+
MIERPANLTETDLRVHTVADEHEYSKEQDWNSREYEVLGELKEWSKVNIKIEPKSEKLDTENLQTEISDQKNTKKDSGLKDKGMNKHKSKDLNKK